MRHSTEDVLESIYAHGWCIRKMNRMVENYLRCFSLCYQNDSNVLLSTAKFAKNFSVFKNLGSSPSELDLGLIPRIPLDFNSGTEVPDQSVEDFKLKLKRPLEDAQFSYKVTKACQASECASQYKPQSYKIRSKL